MVSIFGQAIQELIEERDYLVTLKAVVRVRSANIGDAIRDAVGAFSPTDDLVVVSVKKVKP